MRLPPFRSHPFLRGGHAQTVAGVVWPGRLPPYRAARRHVRLADGDVIVLHDDAPQGWRRGGRAALLVHGLAGCHLSPYMIRVAAKLNAAGVRTFRLDLRDCGAGQGLARRPYHAGKSEDVLAALAELAAICPESNLALIGFSLGGNLALKLLGQSAADVPPRLRRAVAINPPLDLAVCALALRAPLARIYDRHLVGLLWRQLARRALAYPDEPTCDLSRRPRDLWAFDDLFTAPAAGFESARHYYECSSAAQFLPQVRVPTLILSSRDDPLVPAGIFEGLSHSPAVSVHVAEGGGHLGYVARRGPDPDRRWMDWRIVEWISEPSH